MPLIPDWRRVAVRAWSVRLMVGLAVLQGLDAATGLLPIPWWATAAISVAAAGSRLIPQRAISGGSDAEERHSDL